jgi:hypothetical protein
VWAYNNDIDLHAVTGAGVAGINLETFMAYKDADDYNLKKIFKENRQKAKGCIAEGQLVTTDKGLVPIEQVTTNMKVWDGIEWVNHDGIIYQGEKYVMEYAGLIATPDHIVLTDVGAMPFYLAFEYNFKLLKKVPNRNATISFYYGNIEEVDYLKGKLDETITTRSIIRKAEGYGFRHHHLVTKNFTTRCYYWAKWYIKKAMGA